MVANKRRRHQRDLRLKSEQPNPAPIPSLSSTERLPVNRTGIGAAFSDEELALMVSVWDEEHGRKSKQAKKLRRPGAPKPAP